MSANDPNNVGEDPRVILTRIFNRIRTNSGGAQSPLTQSPLMPMVDFMITINGNDVQLAVSLSLEALRDFVVMFRDEDDTAAPEPIPEAMLTICPPPTGDACSICLNGDGDEEDGAPWVSLAACGHRFHGHCIRQWGRPSCPLCRAAQRE